MRYTTLMAAQMAAYPDSVVLTDNQMMDLLRIATPDWLLNHKYEDWKDDNARHEMGWFAHIYYQDWRSLQIEQERAQWARAAFMYRTTYPDGFFYACGKRADGTYRYVGFRYGLEEHEYASGFVGMTYTPQGEVR